MKHCICVREIKEIVEKRLATFSNRFNRLIGIAIESSSRGENH